MAGLQEGGDAVTTTRVASPDGCSWAVFSLFRQYRYALGRSWGGMFDTAHVLFAVGLNPSKAGVDDDQTIRKEVGFAKRLGCTRLLKVNLYGLIETDSKLLEERAMDPVGLDNDATIRRLAAELAFTGVRVTALAAWGSHRLVTLERVSTVRAMLSWPLHCLGRTADGSPRHPSRIAYATKLELWSDRV